jgi:hypothetical protein
MKISDTALCKRIGFEPHESQAEIMKAGKEKRDITICAGVRFGKSKLCGYQAFKRLLADNQRIWIVSLTYDMAKKIFDYVVDFAGMYDRRILKGLSNRPVPRLEVKEWNSWIECKSADNETSLMGEELDLAILDEAARMKPDIMDRYIQARLSTRRGKSFVISTPFGQNWFYRRYMQTKDANDGASFHFESRDNPHFPPEEWDKAKLRLPSDIFQQEYQAVFLADAAAVFRNIRNCIKDNCLQDPKSGHRYVMGLDLAKYNDFTVLTILDKDTHELVYWDRFNKISYPLQISRIKDAARRYGATVVIDALNVGAAVADDLRASEIGVIDFKATGNDSENREMQGTKERAIEKLNSFFETGNISIPANDILIGELEAYGYKMTDAGNLKYGAPEGLHDDCVSSLMIAVWGLHGKARSTLIRAKQLMPRRANVNRFQYL